MLNRSTCILAAVATGVLLELAMQQLTGRREAWDSPIYWTIGLPITVAIAVLLGYLARGRDWLAAIAIVPSQVFTMMVAGGELGTLFPLTLALSAILSAPFVAAAFAGSKLRTLVRRPAD